MARRDFLWGFSLFPIRQRRPRYQFNRRYVGRLRFEELETRCVLDSDSWQNSAFPTDVNDDGHIAP
jgi:hypothetical protein